MPVTLASIGFSKFRASSAPPVEELYSHPISIADVSDIDESCSEDEQIENASPQNSQNVSNPTPIRGAPLQVNPFRRFPNAVNVTRSSQSSVSTHPVPEVQAAVENLKEQLVLFAEKSREQGKEQDLLSVEAFINIDDELLKKELPELREIVDGVKKLYRKAQEMEVTEREAKKARLSADLLSIERITSLMPQKVPSARTSTLSDLDRLKRVIASELARLS